LSDLFAVKRGDIARQLDDSIFDAAIDATQRCITCPQQNALDLIKQRLVILFDAGHYDTLTWQH